VRFLSRTISMPVENEPDEDGETDAGSGFVKV
jgi:hypothetical protein